MMKKHGNGRNEDGKITRILFDSWCHQCKMKHQKIVVCDHFWDEDKTTKCNGRYCNNCCKRHYGEEIANLENLENWTCYRCSDRCVCAACRRMRNGELPPNIIQPTGNLIQKGKRKRIKTKVMDEMGESDESNEDEEEFYPNKFEKNLRSRKNNTSNNTNTNVYSNNTNVLPNPNIKKQIPIEKQVATRSSPRSSPPKKTKVEIPKTKIIIPSEDLEKANTNNSMFEILLEVSALESLNSESSLSKSTNNNVNINQPNKIDPKKQEQLQKFLKYDSVTSNPLHPSSFQTVVHLRQEISQLTTELNTMRQEFSKLQRTFEEYVQTHEGSHESSPINFNEYNNNSPSPYFNQHPLGLHYVPNFNNFSPRSIEERKNLPVN